MERCATPCGTAPTVAVRSVEEPSRHTRHRGHFAALVSRIARLATREPNTPWPAPKPAATGRRSRRPGNGYTRGDRSGCCRSAKGTAIRMRVDHLLGGGTNKPVWLWCIQHTLSPVQTGQPARHTLDEPPQQGAPNPRRPSKQLARAFLVTDSKSSSAYRTWAVSPRAHAAPLGTFDWQV